MRGLADFASTWLLWAFALFGVVGALSAVIRLIRRVRFAAPPAISLVVLVQNQEQQAERLVRMLMRILRRAPWVSCRCQLLLLDLGSTDGTAYILDRLALQDPAIRVLHVGSEHTDRPYDSAWQECPAPFMVSLDLRAKADPIALLALVDKMW